MNSNGNDVPGRFSWRGLLTLSNTLTAFFVFFASNATAAGWSASGPLHTVRGGHTATVLSNGKVLIAGGNGFGNYLTNAELYDPATGSSTVTGGLNFPRVWHTATMLTNGEVLVVGGYDGTNYLATAETYDPVTGIWTPTAPLHEGRAYHTATLLQDGQVLVAGGLNTASSNQYLSSAEIFDPATGQWTQTSSLNTNRANASATLLPNGEVLVAGGFNLSNRMMSCAEVFDPANQSWQLTTPMTVPRYSHSATLLLDGTVLVAGGMGTNNFPNRNLQSSELYDPTDATWTPAGSMSMGRSQHTATLLPNGKVLVVDGMASAGLTNTVETYNPANRAWSTNNPTLYYGALHTATLLTGGRVLVTAGNTTEIFDSSVGIVNQTGPMSFARSSHKATLLSNGKVLVIGGGLGGAPMTSELYDPSSGSWAQSGMLNYNHGAGQTLTLLSDGKALLCGGSGAGSTAEMYDPDTEQWSVTGSMNFVHFNHTATLLPNGKVLIAGGVVTPGSTNAEIYDPAAGAWTVTGSMNFAHQNHGAVLLPNGKVLLFGGSSNGKDSELYDPVLGKWAETGALKNVRNPATAVLLPSGKVFTAGGGSGYTEIYDPASGNWSLSGFVTNVTQGETVNLMSGGKVILVGGNGPGVNTVETYDPATGVCLAATPLNTSLTGNTTTLLPGGEILIAGGITGSGPTTNSEIYYFDSTDYMNDARPQISSIPTEFRLGDHFAITGFGFRGSTDGSGGNNCQDSPTDHPMLELRSIESGEIAVLQATNWTDNSLTTSPFGGFSPGYALATVFVNGIPSVSSFIHVQVPVLQTTVLVNSSIGSDGSFKFSFTNSVGGLFGALASTNASLPLSNWTVLSGVTEVSPGQFQFSDPQATNNLQRYYLLYAP